MTIGGHISGTPASQSLLLDSLKILSAEFPEDHFIFFTEKPLNDLNANCTEVLISPKPKNKLILFYWYSYKLPSLLLRYNTDAFISDAGMVSLKTDTQQYLYFHNDHFDKKSNSYFKRIFRAGLIKAKHIFTAEDFIKEELTEEYNVPEAKIKTVYHGADTEQNTGAAQEQEIKMRFTGGCDYLLYPVTDASAPHLTILLKAFSQLKKWQKSSMKLILLLQNMPEENLVPDFKNYKYREDVVMISDTGNHTMELIQNAFSLIWFCRYPQMNTAITAIQNNVPVIAAENKINKSLFNEAAIFSAISEKELALKMQLLYKEEAVKNEAIQKASVHVKKYDAAAAAHALRSTLMQ